MNDLDIAAPLAAALSAKGYEALTAVQLAVIAPEIAGRDLLVSAQTGSGKTVAFGLAMAAEVLGGVDKLLYADKPLALVVAPTRELAQQVQREFEWLYAGTGALIASCVGGMDYRTEKRALDRGAHIVVGTPGRLRDHIERRSLDLSGVKAVVLDEADEMLDLGFAEDLEFILGSAAEERRTMMFSATVPKEIEKLAATFQRDALRIVAQGESKQHTDIEYRALSVQARDREHAIFNVLRFYEAQTAIVFCKTRVNVNHLLARMANRGFQAVALSGELSQTERMHALQALRDGRARICIATDVAARGIDLPGLELVIHADLPSNSETLLHRSGRTGRAGKKGTSVLIVPPAEFKKAQRLLQGAKLAAEWGKAPSAEEVQAKDDVRLLEHPALAADAADETVMVTQLLERFGPEQVAAGFVRLWREGRSAPEVLSDAVTPVASAPRERGEFGPSVWFSLSVGHTGRAEARWLLPKVCETGGITKDGIGAIRVQQEQTFVQIADQVAGRFPASVEIEPGLVMTKLDGEPSMERPERPAFGAKPERRAPAPRAVREERPAREERPVTAERAERPSYSGKPPRVVEEGAEGSGWSPATDTAPPREAEGARSYDKKPYAPRAAYGEKKAYTPRAAEGEKKPYAPRAAYGDKKPYAPRDADGEKKPYAPRAAYGDKKPYAPREGGGYGDKKPYAPRAAGAEGETAKPRWKGEAGKSAGFKSHGGSPDRPAKAAGFKTHGDKPAYAPRGDGPAKPRGEWAPKADGAKPYRGKSEGGADARPYKGKPDGAKPEGRTWGSKPAGSGGAKPFAKPKPAAPRMDAKDTSKRFVPPKKK
ncbi:DEAD/DEAH box helicase [Paragemmobacter straminiformis]|uniref:DEAD/DEAH box helicase n=1 Tax=Paragemmobacter straminiformis TaxID=2045119 RepID=A0A842I921_9RHOB|nr:DEAD/DEAH box helicase [Gemmobacter straminiformis]MBC2836129.1 DEAD/DEAH box helicase [Gemmobacter straminiformis]